LILTVIALLLGCVYTGRGLFLLGFSNTRPTDLALRWREVKYVCSGINPYDISDYLYRKENGLALPEKPPQINPELGGTSCASGYPPWAFTWSVPFIPPIEWKFARSWFFALNAASLAAIALMAWRLTPQYAPIWRLFPIACVFSMNAIGTTLGNGQWGIILCTLLALTTFLLRRSACAFPALLYAISLLKPTFGFTHAAVFLKKNNWKCFIFAGLFTAFSWMATSWHLGINPTRMLSQMLEQTTRWADVSYSIPDALPLVGIPRSAAMLGCMVAGLSGAAWLLRIDHRDPIYELAVCTTLARVFAYHQLYDNVMLVFLVMAHARHVLSSTRLSDFAILSLLLFSVWIPGRFTDLPTVQVLQIVVWLSSLGWLVMLKKSLQEKPGATPCQQAC
jgi:hypothetical protein